MYIYYKGLIIREGTKGIPSEKIHNLFEHIQTEKLRLLPVC